ncbi:Uncharacterized membrane protein YoaK, UPF0700 family [Butyrivibrio sp. Su6]|uniref:YoaK family protein n=1 Tax=Butyrivibrio sp. Su6 TaxID=1520810 RepID=UPI00089F5CD4|nr:YoaK family protein [Butyrivibrio sp. Su6]SEG32830.1 Uncharacterized membrane protein YoaK, UPF0700 family [Butyrivibrio sp. Su6]
MINREIIKNKITTQKQISDSLFLNLLLAFSGGFQDAYTYIVRDKVFANAQTGNIVLMSTHLMAGHWMRGFKYLFPLLSFVIGVFIADVVQHKFKNAKTLHWRQGIVLVEIAIMILVGFLPQGFNTLACCLISFACAMQLSSFKKVHQNPYASTMCIGNMRSGTAAFSAYLRSKDRKDLNKTLDYVVVIFVFACGAGIGGNLSKLFGEMTILTSAVLLFIGFLMMDLDRKS